MGSSKSIRIIKKKKLSLLRREYDKKTNKYYTVFRIGGIIEKRWLCKWQGSMVPSEGEN